MSLAACAISSRRLPGHAWLQAWMASSLRSAFLPYLPQLLPWLPGRRRRRHLKEELEGCLALRCPLCAGARGSRQGASGFADPVGEAQGLQAQGVGAQGLRGATPRVLQRDGRVSKALRLLQLTQVTGPSLHYPDTVLRLCLLLPRGACLAAARAAAAIAPGARCCCGESGFPGHSEAAQSTAAPQELGLTLRMVAPSLGASGLRL